MSLIPSSTTINLNSSLTETGRKYLFGVDDKNNNQIRFDSNGNDLFLPINFSIYDSDTNYKSSTKLQSGDVPEFKGSGFTNGLNSCYNSKRKNTIINSKGFSPNISFDTPNLYIKESIGSEIKLKINLEQYFNYQKLGNISYLLYVDTDFNVNDNTINFENFTIVGAENITIDSVDYYGIVYTPTFGKKTDLATVVITSSETLTQDQNAIIKLKLKPLTNCDFGLITETNINVLGTLLPLRNISFETNEILVENKQANGTVDSYVNLLLSEVDFKKIKRVDVEIIFGEFLGPISLSPISIELMQPTSIQTINSEQTVVVYSDTYISTFVENASPISIDFNKNKDKVSFKIQKPYLSNINSEILDIENNITSIQIEITTLNDANNSLISQLNSSTNTYNNLIQTRNTSQTSVNNLTAKLAQHVLDKENSLKIASDITSYLSSSLPRLLATNYGKLNDLNTIAALPPPLIYLRDPLLIKLFTDLANNEIQSAINSTQSQLNVENNNLNNINSQIVTIQNNISNINTQITNLNYSVQKLTLETEIKRLQDLVLLGKSIVFKIIKTYNNTNITTYDSCNYIIT